MQPYRDTPGEVRLPFRLPLGTVCAEEAAADVSADALVTNFAAVGTRRLKFGQIIVIVDHAENTVNGTYLTS
jgi:hypothetical protein